MKNIKRQGFTLVELIVVITILAILGSIAFISLQGYSSDARNSKRTSDLNSIVSSMSTQLAQGQSILSFVTGLPINQTTGLSIAGTGVLLTTDYNAGPINYAALPVKAADFQDPTGSSYVGGVTIKNNGRYELAATIEQGQGSKIAKVVGNYTPRTAVFIGAATGAVLTNLALSLDKDINFFNPGDTITVAGTGRTITKISVDGKTITLNATFPLTATGLILNANETAGLINDKAATSTVGETVTEAGNFLPY